MTATAVRTSHQTAAVTFTQPHYGALQSLGHWQAMPGEPLTGSVMSMLSSGLSAASRCPS